MMPADLLEQFAYERICAEACADGCGTPDAAITRPGIHLHANGKYLNFRCKAPSRDAVIESQANDLARVTKERDEARFAPMGDNHHNAARCPYCRSQTDAGMRDALTNAQRELAALKRERDELRADNLALLSLAIWTVDGLKAPWTVFQPAKLIVEREKDAARTAQQEGKP